ncbi:MAG TPA: nickel pincer cofactor biosynthesis protein LarB [Bacteroidales bacterium]|nr:nickel pincer cofactor biosynthesis protein LarB [Bacteroidales bacterium]
MKTEELKKLLAGIQDGTVEIDQAMDKLKYLPFKDLGHTRLDHHRELRQGYPEVIYCQGKTVDQVLHIAGMMFEHGQNVLGTRASREMYDAIKKKFPQAVYHELSRALTIKQHDYNSPDTYLSVVSAGTSDIPVAEEAAVTAEFYNNKVEKFYDIGVAGIHRIQENIEVIAGARAIVVVAGMEGALPSVIGGLVDKPVIAVPTSVGYGASFHGITALLGMLTSCASGVSVVNIDNGFGAGYLASMINKL